MVVRWLIQAKIYENYSSEWEIKARRVKSHNKASTNVIYYNYDKMSDIAEAKYEYDKNSPKLSRAPQGRRLGDETPRRPRSPGSAERTPSRRQELSSGRVSPRGKRVE